jgi:hypothetical protein
MGNKAMTETTNPAPPTPKGKWWETPAYRAVSKWFMIVCAAIVGVLGLVKMYHAFSPQMPDCSASETGGVIRNIFTQKNITLTKLSDMTQVNETSAERNCSAHIETNEETATIFYRITLENKEFKVLITKVDAKPR